MIPFALAPRRIPLHAARRVLSPWAKLARGRRGGLGVDPLFQARSSEQRGTDVETSGAFCAAGGRPA